MGRDTLNPSNHERSPRRDGQGLVAQAPRHVAGAGDVLPSAGEWPGHGARSTHRKPARGDPPFRRGSDARGAGATDPCPACRCRAARNHPARATARASKTSPHLVQRPHKSAMNLFFDRRS